MTMPERNEETALRVMTGVIAFGIGAIFTMMVGLAVGLEVKGNVECYTFAVASPPDAYGIVFIGAIDMCGRDFEFSPVYGPIPELPRPSDLPGPPRRMPGGGEREPRGWEGGMPPQ